ncbi:MAG: hypothetical protein M1823_001809 [Watsoniomyces obsoletus]|nr:MAG: hypothetical protein M1823_001809 [Watsoniomyces obsoletus]
MAFADGGSDFSGELPVGSAQKRNLQEQVPNLEISSSLEELQSDELRHVLDIVSQLRRCGLDSMLSLPQLVVCGDQSAGKSSVLEAATEIDFPRNDNLCTRFATEIILRRAPSDALAIKILPDRERPQHEQEAMANFRESISNLNQLPAVMDKAMALMGIGTASETTSKAFAKDVLSVEIEGPTRPQLTLVDLPGLIQTETKGVTAEDVQLVSEITEHYIKQPRTICLAVVAATNDYANQGILKRVRAVDREGDRTLGIITKPDRLPSGSGSEQAYIDLAKNQDIFFKLGWHVLKNRSFEESGDSFQARNASEASYFRRSNFSALPRDCVGIDALRDRLSRLLFNHVKQELPRLRTELDEALADSQRQMKGLGERRSSPEDCRRLLTQLSLNIHDTCKAAVNGYYEGDYFSHKTDKKFFIDSVEGRRRFRAVVRSLNFEFAKTFRKSGHKYFFNNEDGHGTEDGGDGAKDGSEIKDEDDGQSMPASLGMLHREPPTKLSRSDALGWVEESLKRTRGRELDGNFNPLLISELFWEQSERWEKMARDHIDRVAHRCRQFLQDLLSMQLPKDVYTRLWSAKVEDALKVRYEDAVDALEEIMEDVKGHPMTCNHYYTDTIQKRRRERERDVERLAANAYHTAKIDPDMNRHSIEEALDCLVAIYKLSQKTFIDNIIVQVVERHMVRGLETIFSPVMVNGLSEAETLAIASESTSVKRQRDFLEDRIKKLKDGERILRDLVLH